MYRRKKVVHRRRMRGGKSKYSRLIDMARKIVPPVDALDVIARGKKYDNNLGLDWSPQPAPYYSEKTIPPELLASPVKAPWYKRAWSAVKNSHILSKTARVFTRGNANAVSNWLDQRGLGRRKRRTTRRRVGRGSGGMLPPALVRRLGLTPVLGGRRRRTTRRTIRGRGFWGSLWNGIKWAGRTAAPALAGWAVKRMIGIGKRRRVVRRRVGGRRRVVRRRTIRGRGVLSLIPGMGLLGLGRRRRVVRRTRRVGGRRRVIRRTRRVGGRRRVVRRTRRTIRGRGLWGSVLGGLLPF